MTIQNATPAQEPRASFELFKSNVCHRLKTLGDIDFLIEALEHDAVRSYYRKGWYPESLYLLATVQRTFERLNAGIAKGSAIILNRVLLFCAERSVSMDNLFQEFNSLHEPPPVDNVVNEDTDHPIYIKICLHKPAGLTSDGERTYRYIGEFLQKASSFLCSQCSHWQSPEHDSIFFSSECPIYQMASTMIASLNENHTKGGQPEDV